MDSVRFIRYHKEEVAEIKELYESVLTVASHGLFFRTGRIIGGRIATRAKESNGDFLATAAKIIQTEGWVNEINFKDGEVVTKGSIEVNKTNLPTCHMLRGVLSSIVENRSGQRTYCHEVQCESQGNDKCVFKMDSEVM